MPSVADHRVAASNRALQPGLGGRPVAALGEGLGAEPVVVVDAVRPLLRTTDAPTLAIARIFHQHTERSELVSQSIGGGKVARCTRRHSRSEKLLSASRKCGRGGEDAKRQVKIF